MPSKKQHAKSNLKNFKEPNNDFSIFAIISTDILLLLLLFFALSSISYMRTPKTNCHKRHMGNFVENGSS